MTAAQPDRLDRLEALVEANTVNLAKLEARLEKQAERWDERYFQLTRDTLGTAKTIIVTAGTVVILSPLLQALSPAIKELVVRLMGGQG